MVVGCSMNTNVIHNQDCLVGLKNLPDNSIDCCVTSPPYYGLRDYGHADQIGLEDTPMAYVAKMTEVFNEVLRVLKPTGTLWLNIGDSYASFKDGKAIPDSTRKGDKGTFVGNASNRSSKNFVGTGIKNKDLIGIPWRLAFAMQDAGWYLRQDIIWHKPNPMPESVTDRCTKSHEYLFLMTKEAHYYFDQDAIKEVSSDFSDKRNKRSVWTVATKPFADAHFATYPIELISPCILAGCPENGIVLDPFMGAGTTALAALMYNRKFIGFELNHEYLAIANKRIKPHLVQTKLF